MSKAGGRRSRPTVASEQGEKLVALIAGNRPREVISDALERAGFVPMPFDCVDAVLEMDIEAIPACATIVVWVEDTISATPGLIEPLTRSFARSPVVVVCASIQRWELRAALVAGAAGIVVFDELSTSLGPCLQAVRAGQTCVPRGHWRQIEPPVLSTREKQILGLVVMGYMNGQIAEKLFLAESTVKSHLSSAFGKLGVRSRNEAVALILDPDRGFGMGILGLGGEPIETVTSTV
jgi:DNA-binding NarL/FixJ family response regulator